MIWPNDADGDVFRRLEGQRFDFSKPSWIDFNIDFDEWPPPDEIVRILSAEFPNAIINRENDEDGGYVIVKLFDIVSYEFVTNTQDVLSKMMSAFGGVCESWGIFGSQ